jgi:hypothetical protein
LILSECKQTNKKNDDRSKRSETQSSHEGYYVLRRQGVP